MGTERRIGSFHQFALTKRLNRGMVLSEAILCWLKFPTQSNLKRKQFQHLGSVGSIDLNRKYYLNRGLKTAKEVVMNMDFAIGE